MPASFPIRTQLVLFAAFFGNSAVCSVFPYVRNQSCLRRYGYSADCSVSPNVRDWLGLRRYGYSVACPVFPYVRFDVVCVGMGMVRSGWYSRTYAIGVVCVVLGMARLGWYSRACAVGSVCDGAGMVLVVGKGKGSRGSCWNHGTPCAERVCAVLSGSYLLRTFLNRSEDALARASCPKPGSTEARLAVMIWSKVLFFMVCSFRRVLRPSVSSSDGSVPSCRPRSVLCVFLFLVLLLCLHRTSGAVVRACRARRFLGISVGLS